MGFWTDRARFAGKAAAAFGTAVLCCGLLLVGCTTGAGNAASGNGADASGASVSSAAVAQSSAADDGEGAGSANVGQASVPDKPNADALYQVLEEDEATRLIELANTDANVAWVAANPDAYADYGYEAQAKLLKLVADDPLAASYVRNFNDRYPAEGPDYNAPAMDTGSPSPDVPETGMPHLYQWDERWGYVPYGGFCMGVSACGPTSLAIIYQGLTGDNSVSPYDMAQLAYEMGCVSNLGTGNNLLYDACEALGLVCWEIPATAESIVEALGNGTPIIANVGIGYFSTSGHFFVLAGITDDGLVILNDPYSVTRSSLLWDPEFIASESMMLIAYAPAEWVESAESAEPVE